uniref:MARVEL domain-containing protein n=1 Tax=Oryctolagus cuniculus TaxID=9986 RepID=A0A5F9CEV3_RABIT
GLGALASPSGPVCSSRVLGGAWVFSIVVFGAIVNEGYLNSPSEGEEFCIYNRNASACSYGVTVGVLAFLTCLLYLALDVYFPQISSVKDRKKAVLSDIGVSAFWAFLWFVGFCFLANQWQVSKPKDNPLNEGTDAARAAIAFSFFSIFTWVSPAAAEPALGPSLAPGLRRPPRALDRGAHGSASWPQRPVHPCFGQSSLPGGRARPRPLSGGLGRSPPGASSLGLPLSGLRVPSGK